MLKNDKYHPTNSPIFHWFWVINNKFQCVHTPDILTDPSCRLYSPCHHLPYQHMAKPHNHTGYVVFRNTAVELLCSITIYVMHAYFKLCVESYIKDTLLLQLCFVGLCWHLYPHIHTVCIRIWSLWLSIVTVSRARVRCIFITSTKHQLV